jgi:hypothetical protein
MRACCGEGGPVAPSKTRTLFFLLLYGAIYYDFPGRAGAPATVGLSSEALAKEDPRSRVWRISRLTIPIFGAAPVFKCQRTLSLTTVGYHTVMGYSSVFF